MPVFRHTYLGRLDSRTKLRQHAIYSFFLKSVLLKLHLETISMKPIILSILTSLLAIPAHAATYTYDFTAAFESRSGTNAASTIVDTAAGFSTLSGTLVLDDTLVSAAATSATYGPASITINEFAIGAAGTLDGTRVDNIGGFDQFVGLNDVPSDGQYYDRISFIIRDSTAAAFSSTVFPNPLVLADFDAPTMLFTSSTTASARERIDFRFTDLTVRAPSAVPLPAGLPLLLGGMGLLALVRRRKSS
ncbi:VPLPA-CTERM sorting domain-containing protein [Roseovarius sp. ZX-A-9]|uniref:VPLPA-CTERM sorting domain-containing protein n=1 Tax=Roseovarius sp. ZX-A-9 TaxID=3014783 RepID=UPI00232D29C8|nr:VPLPA-CTERM sorting domain-containing protein [Roseovarius sp. ZX-A-9]